jgi:hypothetical protein
MAEDPELREEDEEDPERLRDRVFEANKHLSTLSATGLALTLGASRFGPARCCCDPLCGTFRAVATRSTQWNHLLHARRGVAWPTTGSFPRHCRDEQARLDWPVHWRSSRHPGVLHMR